MTPAPGASGLVSTWAISPTTGASGTVPAKRREHVAVLGELDVLEADLPQLRRRASARGRAASACSGRSPVAWSACVSIDDVAQEAREHVLGKLLRERETNGRAGRAHQLGESAEELARSSRRPGRVRRPEAARSASGCSIVAARSRRRSPGSPLAASAETSGIEPPRPDQQRPHAEHGLERVLRQPDRRSVGRDESRRRPTTSSSTSSSAPRARPREAAARRPARSRPASCPRREAHRDVRPASTGSTVFWSSGEPPSMPLTSTDGSRPRAELELVAAAPRSARSRPAAASSVCAASAAPPSPRALRRVGGMMPTRSASGTRPSARRARPERRDERVQRVQRGTAEHPGVQVALAGAHLDVEVEDAAQPRCRTPARRARRIPPSRTSATSAPRSSSLDPIDDRVPADLLLAVAREAHVDGQLARGGEQLGRLEEHEQVRLVVGDARARRASRRARRARTAALPELERVGRLHVEVRVDEHVGASLGTARGRAPRRSRAGRPLPVDDLGRCRRPPGSRSAPTRRPRATSARVRGIGADRRDRDQLGELGDRARHATASRPRGRSSRDRRGGLAQSRLARLRHVAHVVAPRRARGASSGSGARSAGCAHA